jgi:hypothetical protein
VTSFNIDLKGGRGKALILNIKACFSIEALTSTDSIEYEFNIIHIIGVVE